MFNFLIYTKNLETDSYLLKCSIPLKTQSAVIDALKRPYHYMSQYCTRDYIDGIVLTDSAGDVILGLDLEARTYLNAIDGLKYKTLHDYVDGLIKQLLKILYYKEGVSCLW